MQKKTRNEKSLSLEKRISFEKLIFYIISKIIYLKGTGFKESMKPEPLPEGIKIDSLTDDCH